MICDRKFDQRAVYTSYLKWPLPTGQGIVADEKGKTRGKNSYTRTKNTTSRETFL